MGFLRRRLREQVEASARAAYVTHGVDQTRRRLGVLLYCSAREKRAVIIADQTAEHGLLAKGRLAPLERALAQAWSRGALNEIKTNLEALGKYFAEVFPADQDRHELHQHLDAEAGQ